MTTGAGWFVAMEPCCYGAALGVCIGIWKWKYQSILDGNGDSATHHDGSIEGALPPKQRKAQAIAGRSGRSRVGTVGKEAAGEGRRRQKNAENTQSILRRWGWPLSVSRGSWTTGRTTPPPRAVHLVCCPASVSRCSWTTGQTTPPPRAVHPMRFPAVGSLVHVCGYSEAVPEPRQAGAARACPR